MKFTRIMKRGHKVLGGVEYLGCGIVENAVEMTTGYRNGGGTFHKVIPVNSEVFFILKEYSRCNETSFVGLVIYEIKPDGTCSEYFHTHKWNNKKLEDVVSMLNLATA